METTDHSPVISEALQMLGKTLDDLKTVLFSQSTHLLRQIKKEHAEFHAVNLQVVEKTIAHGAGSASDRQLLAALPALQGIGIAARNLLSNIRAKLETGTVFTEKALTEIAEIMALAKDLARDTSDAMITEQPSLRTYVVDSAHYMLKKADEYGLAHQQRLIEGDCSLTASFLYLHIMLSLKGIAQELSLLSEKV